MDTTYTFQSAHGKYLCAEGGGGGAIVANRELAASWEQFTILPAGDKLWCLATDNGHFIRCEGGGGSTVDATATSVGPWESYRLIQSENGDVVQFGTWDGMHYLTAELDGSVVANRTIPASWESWTAAPPLPTKIISPRKGRVRLSGRSFEDDGGKWLAVGSSLFWAVRGAAIERDRYLQNLTWLKDRGVDFVRVFADTSDWPADCRTDPRLPWWQEGVYNLLADCHKLDMRVWWTLFGSNALNKDEQWNALQTVMQASDIDPAQVQGIEISNEDLGFQDTDGRSRMLKFANACRVGNYPVALTSAAHVPDGFYANSPANIGNEHFDRTYGEKGYRYIRQPWGYWERPMMPPAYVSLEPCGIGSSVCQDTDVARQIMAAVVTWVSGGAGYVVHTGAGIYGVPNHNAAGGDRPANVWEQPTLAPILAGIAAQRKILPGDLASWDRQNAAWYGHPFTFAPDALGDVALANKHGASRAYAMTKAGGAYVCTPECVMGSLIMMPKDAGRTYHVYLPDGTLAGEGHGVLTVGEPAAVVVSLA